MSSVFIATAKNGVLNFGSSANENRLRAELKDNEGKSYRLTKVETKRSTSQNSFYRAYLKIISRETGDDENSLHEYFKRALLPAKFITVLGKEVKIPASTTELTKTEFSEYLDRICFETNIPVPDPAELEKYGYIIK